MIRISNLTLTKVAFDHSNASYVGFDTIGNDGSTVGKTYEFPETAQKIYKKIGKNGRRLIGFGALGLGAYGLTKALKKKEDEQSQK